jgi:putative effector of murein hydrolase LrgA (UPF0299 family)
VAAPGAAGALGVVLAWLLPQLGVDIPGPVQAAVVFLLMLAVGYLKTERGTIAALLARRKDGAGEHAG